MPDRTFRIPERAQSPLLALWDLATRRGDVELAQGLLDVLEAIEADGDERSARNESIRQEAASLRQDSEFRRTWELAMSFRRLVNG